MTFEKEGKKESEGGWEEAQVEAREYTPSNFARRTLHSAPRVRPIRRCNFFTRLSIRARDALLIEYTAVRAEFASAEEATRSRCGKDVAV